MYSTVYTQYSTVYTTSILLTNPFPSFPSRMILVEAQVQNLTSRVLFFEKVKFDAPPAFSLDDLTVAQHDGTNMAVAWLWGREVWKKKGR